MSRWWRVVVGMLVLAPGSALAGLELPPGFKAQVYVTGEGFDSNTGRGARGIPSSATLTVDHAGVLYLARNGRRYFTGEADDIFPIYRIPVGGAQLTPQNEARYFYGPPLPNPQVGPTRDGRELFVTTFDRERKVGVLYRIAEGRAELLAGGTPERGAPPLLKQPEGVAVDAGGGFFVADRDQGLIVRLDPTGRVLSRRYLAVTRPRVLAGDGTGSLWIGSDGNAEAPWQQGPGEIWQVSPEGVPRVVLRGPVAQALALSPGGSLVVADRHEAQLFIVSGSRGSRMATSRAASPSLPSRPRPAARASPATSSWSPSTAGLFR